MQEWLDMWKNYSDFSGRTDKRGYWVAFLINVVISGAIGLLFGLIGLEFVSIIYALAVLVPGLAIMTRRLRDAGKAWQWMFISLVPVVGWIWIIVLLCGDSVPGDSGYTVL